MIGSSSWPKRKRLIGSLIVGLVLSVPIVIVLYATWIAQQSLALRSLVSAVGGKVDVQTVAPEWLPDRVRNADLFLRATEVHLESFPHEHAAMDATLESYWLDFRLLPCAYDSRVSVAISKIPSVTALFLDSYAIGDDDLAQWAALPNIEVLTISRTNCTSQGLIHLQTWRRLTHLSCSSLPLDDAAVPHLERLTGLRHLDVSHTAISEAGIAKLAALPHLRMLRIIGLGVSGEMVDELRRRYPHLSIEYKNVFGHEHDWSWDTPAPRYPMMTIESGYPIERLFPVRGP